MCGPLVGADPGGFLHVAACNTKQIPSLGLGKYSFLPWYTLRLSLALHKSIYCVERLSLTADIPRCFICAAVHFITSIKRPQISFCEICCILAAFRWVGADAVSAYWAKPSPLLMVLWCRAIKNCMFSPKHHESRSCESMQCYCFGGFNVEALRSFSGFQWCLQKVFKGLCR